VYAGVRVPVQNVSTEKDPKILLAIMMDSEGVWNQFIQILRNKNYLISNIREYIFNLKDFNQIDIYWTGAALPDVSLD
jgi:hypothetical protein